MTTGVFHNRMATHFTSANVIDMISDWDDSGDGGRSFDEDYSPENDAIDIAQSADSLPEQCPTSPMDSSSSSDTKDSDNDPTTPPNLPSRVSSPFNPPPFCRSIGPTSVLGSTATPLDFFMLLFDDSISIWLLLKQICMHPKILLETDISGMILTLMK